MSQDATPWMPEWLSQTLLLRATRIAAWSRPARTSMAGASRTSAWSRPASGRADPATSSGST